MPDVDPSYQDRRFVVVKLGGSLLDTPLLAERVTRWLKDCSMPSILVVGGGAAVDWLRRLDQLHSLPKDLVHWLAIEAMQWNARWLSAILLGSILVSEWQQCYRAWQDNLQPILDPLSFCRQDAQLPDNLPIGWQVSSDSIAAQLAWRWQATELVLLKSCPRPAGDWQSLADAGLVDAYFPKIAQRLPRILWVCWSGDREQRAA